MIDLHPLQWALGGLCAVLVGMAKTGVPGLGILVVPLMFHVVGAQASGAGALLPLLCVADLCGVIIFRRHARLADLFHLAPWVALGMGAGALVLGRIDDGRLRLIVGVIVLAMVAAHLWRQRIDESRLATAERNWWHGCAFGLAAGFATTVANAAGPVMGLYLLSMRLPKDQFMGTGVWFFCIINLVKLPIYGVQGMITGPSLVFDLWLLPGVLLGVAVGKRVYDRLPQRLFERVVLGLTIASGASLVLPAHLFR